MADPKFHTVTPPKTLKTIANDLGLDLQNDSDGAYEIKDVAPLKDAGANDITFLDNLKYKDDLKVTKAGACIIAPQMVDHAPEGLRLLITKNPYKFYALTAQNFYPDNYPAANISERAHVHESAEIADGCVIEVGVVIGEGAKLAEGVWVEANTVIGANVEIGAKTRIGANVTVSHAIIGAGSRIYTGARVGQDGFGFAIDLAGHVKVPQLGRVIIGDHVEIGANTCIDRGAGPDSIIGDGVWIDNLVQIGHNVKIGRGSVIVAQVGIAGSAELEDFVVCAGQVGIAGHLKIGQGTRIGAQSGVIKDIPAGSEVIGSPAIPSKEFLRQIVALKRLTKR